jgi:protocatechuate 3,4-dioxygenase beta subunit
MQLLEERAVPDIAGQLFRDNNFDGAFTKANDQGFYAGVTVTAYDNLGASKSVQTQVDGFYTIPTAGLTGPFRIEVTVPSGFVPGPIGPDNKSTVRFESNPSATGVNFGLVNPRDYSQNNPDLITTQYDFGEATSSQGAILRFPSTNNGYFNKASAPYPQQPVPTTLAKVSQVGSLYGLARQAESDTIFAGAFVRRFVGTGPSGPGAIYAVDGSGSQTVNTLVDFNDLGNAKYTGMIPSGSTAADFSVGVDSRRSVPGYDYFNDVNGRNLTHRIGLGDLELSPDSRTIYTVNLRTRELIEIPVTLSGTLDTSRQFRRTAVPLTLTLDPLNFNTPGDIRPFALDVQDGVVYVGSTYTAETSQNRSDLRAYVYAFDSVSGQFKGLNQSTNLFTATLAPVLTADLSYKRENGTVAGAEVYDTLDNTAPIGTVVLTNSNERNRDDSFRPWNALTNTFRNHQPLLTDIDFDRDTMVLGIRDRYGDQVGWFGASPPVPDVGSAEGDILRAHPNDIGGFVLESNGISNGVTNAIFDQVTSSGAGSGTAKYLPQGPGGARFYWSNNLYTTDVDGEAYGFAHSYLSMGGLYQQPGGTRMSTTIMDPLRYSTGGISWFDNLTGARPQNFELYADGELGKANGLGDLEAFENLGPLEVGDRIWLDADGDGIQDPGEVGIANVDLEFWDLGDDGIFGGTGANADTKLATAKTDANGLYLFSGFSGTNTASAIFGLGIQPNRAYEVRIPNLVGQAALAGNVLTATDATDGKPQPDVRDSDLVDRSNTGVIRIVTGAAGSIDHTFDAGFKAESAKLSLGNLIWNDINNDGQVSVGEPGIDGIAVSLHADLNGNGLIDGSDTLLATVTTAGGGAYLFSDLAPGKYIVSFAPPPGFLSSTGNFGNPTSGKYEPGISTNDDNQDHGTLVGSKIQTKSVELFISGNAANPDDSNKANYRQDFGLFRPYSLGNRVWLDANNNGQIDTGEAGIAGATVRLLDATGTTTLLTTTTAAGGYYRFDTLTPGNYIVEIDGAAGPIAGLKSSTGSIFATGPCEPAPAVNSKGDSFDYGSIAGANVRSGTVTIGNATGGDTEPTGEADLGSGDAAIPDDRADLTVDFGFFRPLTLGNRLFVDVNNSGQFDAGDLDGPANVTVNLLDSTGTTVVKSTVTNSQGYYLFTGLNPGGYRVELPASNFTGTGPLVGYISSNGGGLGATTGPNDPIATLAGDNKDSGNTLVSGAVRTAIVTLTGDAAPTGEPATPGLIDPANDANSDVTVDFGVVRVLTLGNLVFEDINNDGQQNGVEPGIANVVVELIRDINNNGLADDAVALKTTTNSKGFYQFTNLVEGKYFVRIAPPAGFISSTGKIGSPSGAYEPAPSPNDKKDQFDDGTTVVGSNPLQVISDFVTLSFGAAPLAEPPSTDLTDLATDANSNGTVDFGLFRPLSLGNRVWDDANNNGLLDAGEKGLGKVTVTLFEAAGKTTIATTATDANGSYLFTHLIPGNYYAEVTVPSGYQSSTGGIGATGPFEPAPVAAPENNLDGNDDGTQIAPTIVRSGTITLSIGGEPVGETDVGPQSATDPAADNGSNLTLDFGLFRPQTIGNLVWNDANNNGILDIDESGIGNVTVNLWSDPEGDGVPNEKLATTTTNLQGSYLFTGLGDGKYIVQVDPLTLPTGYWLTSSGKNGSLTGPFEKAPASSDKNDQVDDGTLTNGIVISSTVTLIAGKAPTAEPSTPGLTDTATDANSNVTIDFGFYRPVSIGNQVFIDANNNGIFEPATEKGLANVPVRLIFDANKNNLPDDGVILSTTTNAIGGYLFNTLAPGAYFVEIDAPAGYLSSTGKNGSATSGPFEPAPAPSSNKDRQDHGTVLNGPTIRSAAIVLAAGTMPTGEPGDPGLTDPTPDNASNYSIDFGLWRPLALGNQVFFDANNDGSFDPGTETGLSNVPVSLFDQLGNLVASTKTAADGTYLFSNLGAGIYTVEITAPANLGSSTGLANQYEPAPDPDDNINNVDDGTTTPAGSSIIRALPIDLQPGQEPGGDTNLTLDFGLYRTMNLGNLVWNDANNNGTVDSGETGIANVTVRLFADANGDGVPDGAALATQSTDKNGNYLFTGLSPGSYVVEVVDPAGFVPSSGKNGSITGGPYEPAPAVDANIDNDDNGSLVAGLPGRVRSSTITLTSGQEPSDQGFTNLTVDFGYFLPLSLGNLVWDDVNNNGKFDLGEKGLSAVPVELLAGTTVIATAKTDSQGLYLFATLVEGDYSVRVTLPSGYVSSTGALSGTGPFEPATDPNDNEDNVDDGTTVTGQTVQSKVVTLTRGAEPNGADKNDNLTVDFGAYRPLSLGNQVFFDANNNGKRDNGETGIAGVTVRLFRDSDANGVPDGAALATQKTTGTGHYLFTGLGEGNFVVEVDTPAGGYRSSTGKNASLSGPFETAPNVNSTPVDDDDNGTIVSGVVRSSTVTVLVGLMPVGEQATPGFTDPATDANGNLTVDFGFNRPMAIGDLVFEDRNNNGIRDTGEAGLANVVVRLLNQTGTATLATTTTDASGNYRFDNVSPGQYLVEIDPLAGYVSSTGGVMGSGPFEPAAAPTGTTNDRDVGTTQTGGAIRSGLVTLTQDAAPVIDGDTDANTDLTIDFGLFRPLSVGNLVWNDKNNSGIVDTGEPGLGAITVNLWSDPEGDGVPNAKLGTTATNSQGSYLFTGLGEGKFIVQVDGTTLPAGLVTSTGKNGSVSGPFEPAPNNAVDNNDNGSVVNGLILSGPINLTLGTAPTGEPATPGITDPATDANSNATIDFGFYRPLSLGNLVWSDFNNSGIVDTGEPGLPNRVVALYDGAGSLVSTTTTDANGNYRFNNLNPNDYYVEVQPGPGIGSSKGPGGKYEPGAPANGNEDNDDNGTQPGALGTVVRSTTITLSVGDEPAEGGTYNPTLDIGLLATAKVSGFVYIDPNIDGKFVTSTGDKPLGGVTVTISGTDAGGNAITPRTTKTDATGFYQFTELPPGTYTIGETQPGGILVDGIDTVGTLGGTTPANDKLTVTLLPNDNGQNYNFGEIPPANAFGSVYVDSNRNGRPDPGERPIPGVAITISGTAFAGTPLARPLTAADLPGGSLTVFTNPAGRWEFPVLPPGNYNFTEVQPAAYLDAQEQNGDPQTNPTISNDRFGSVALRPFPIGGPYNFGEIDPNETDGGKRDFLGSTLPGTNTPFVIPDGDRPLLQLPLSPSFGVSSKNVNTPTFVAYGSGPGATPLIRVFDYATGIEKFRQFAYESSFVGGVRVATGDVNGDGIEDIVTSTGPGGGPRVRVFSGDDGRAILDTFVFESTFRGGVFVATGDVNGDGRADIIVGAEIGGGPRYRAIDGVTGAELLNGFAFEQNQRGGVRVAAADFNADGKADIVATTGLGVATRVRVLNSANGATLADFAPYESTYTGGVFIAAGDITGDGVPDIAVGADQGGGPRVQVFSGSTFTQVNNFFAFEPTFTGGVRMATADLNGDGRSELIVAAGPGGAPRSRIYQGPGLTTVLEDFYPFDPEFLGGSFVG